MVNKSAKTQEIILTYLAQGLQKQQIISNGTTSEAMFYRTIYRLKLKGLVEHKKGLGYVLTEKGYNSHLFIAQKVQSFFPEQYRNWWRGNKLQFTVRILDKPTGWETKDCGVFYKNINVAFGQVGYINHKFILNNDWMTAQIHKDNVVIFIPEITKKTLNEVVEEVNRVLLKACNEIERNWRISLIRSGYANFKVSQQEWACINSDVAGHCHEHKIKILIKHDNGLPRVIIDFSKCAMLGKHTPEMEFISSSTGLDDADNWRKFISEFVDNPISPNDLKTQREWITNSLKVVAQNQIMYGENARKHVEVINKLEQQLKELTEVIKIIKHG